MSSPQSTRRWAVVALAIVWLLVCGGLAWGTRSAIRLDRIEERDAAERSNDELLALAISRLEAAVEAFVGREQYRPYAEYRRFYKPAHAVSAENPNRTPLEPVLLPSPLSAPRLENRWILLYFQATQIGNRIEWGSPQFEERIIPAAPIREIPYAQRNKLATAENWLAGLREHHKDLVGLLNPGPNSMSTQSVRIAARSPRKSSNDADGPSVEPRRTDTELKRRLDKMKDYYPAEVCEPETVALENLGTDIASLGIPSSDADCTCVRRMSLVPIWMDLTNDGHSQLALIRSVYVESSQFWAVQGILIDWDQLRDTLRGEIQDLFPAEKYAHLKLEPVGSTPPGKLEQRGAMMSSLPIRLIVETPGLVNREGLSTGLKVALITAWVASLMAMLAISYGMAKYLGLIERRMRFVAAVTHELRTPLTTFQLYTDLLSNGAANDPAKRSAYVETLKGESSRLARLVENVLAYARIGNKKARLSLSDVSIDDVLDAASSETAYRVKAADKSLVVENQCPEGTVLRIDREFLVQILSNLIDNACKHAVNLDDKRIWLRARPQSAGGVVFEVEDAGPGVAPAERRGIFKPFRRGRGHEATPGMGLGLAMSRYWSECLGGRLQLARGRGGAGEWNRFTLTLPVGA